MPRFNYQRARLGGMTDDEIVEFLDTERSEGREYDLDPASFPALRKARATMMSAQEPGLGQEDPIGTAGAMVGVAGPAMALGRGAVGLAQAGGRMLGRVPARQVVETGAELIGGVPGMLARGARAARGMAVEAAPQAAKAVPEVAEQAIPKGMQQVGGYLRRIRTARKPDLKVVKPKIEAPKAQLPKPVQKRIEAVKKATRRHPALKEKAGAEAASGQSLEGLLKQSIQLGTELEKRGLTSQQRATAFKLLREQME